MIGAVMLAAMATARPQDVQRECRKYDNWQIKAAAIGALVLIALLYWQGRTAP